MSESQAVLMLSVSGMRGLVGQSLTPVEVARYAAALAAHLREHHTGGRPPAVVVGRDSRTSGEAMQAAACSALAACGCRVFRVGVQATPAIAHAIARPRPQLDARPCDGGLIVTASHNPSPWNGCKPLVAITGSASAPPADHARDIIARFDAADPAWTGPDNYPPMHDEQGTAASHAHAVIQHIDADLIRSARLKVALDSTHGAGGEGAMILLTQLGVTLTHLYPEPTGRFPHPPEPTADNCHELCQLVTRVGADVGFAQDTDADRLAIVDERGRYIGEEYTLALGALRAFERGLESETVAVNLSTSRMIDDVAHRFGGRVVRTPVGEANVAAAMRHEHATLGGEGNGGVIWAPLSHVRDSLISMALVLELLAARRQAQAGTTFSHLVHELPGYAIVKMKIDIDLDRRDALTATLPTLLREAFDGEAATIDEQDGVRLDTADAWVHLRPSNTEPIFRVIAEAPTLSQARAMADRAQRAMLG